MKISDAVLLIFLAAMTTITGLGWYMMSGQIITVKQDLHSLQTQLEESRKTNTLQSENDLLRGLYTEGSCASLGGRK